MHTALSITSYPLHLPPITHTHTHTQPQPTPHTPHTQLYINDNDKMPLAITRLYMAEASRELDQQTDVQAYLNEAKQILDFMYAEKSDPHAGPYLLRVLCAFMQKHREWVWSGGGDVEVLFEVLCCCCGECCVVAVVIHGIGVVQ